MKRSVVKVHLQLERHVIREQHRLPLISVQVQAAAQDRVVRAAKLGRPVSNRLHLRGKGFESC